MPESRLGRHVAGQLVRSGTAAAPNYDEGRAGESRADFAHKVNVALKEMVETQGWLKLIEIAKLQPASRIQPLRQECDQLCRILGSSVLTVKGIPHGQSSVRNLETQKQLDVGMTISK